MKSQTSPQKDSKKSLTSSGSTWNKQAYKLNKKMKITLQSFQPTEEKIIFILNHLLIYICNINSPCASLYFIFRLKKRNTR